jgi:SAM-dependent methyltransferase
VGDTELMTGAGLSEFPPCMHRLMLDDKVRVDAFADALARVIRPGDTVVDVGTGTGVLAFLAKKAGAKRVLAIDRSPMVRWARRARPCDFDLRGIEFLQLDAQRDKLPRVRADVIVSELLGSFGLGEEIVATVSRVRDALLAPGGRVVPGPLSLHLVPVSVASLQRDIDAWHRPVRGIDFGPLRPLALNAVYLIPSDTRVRVLGEPGTVARTDLRVARHAPRGGDLSMRITKRGALHGVAGYFHTELAPGVTLSNAPWLPATHWGQVFLPIDGPIAALPGDRLDLAFRTRHGDDAQRWSWRGTLRRRRRVLHRFAFSAVSEFAD